MWRLTFPDIASKGILSAPFGSFLNSLPIKRFFGLIPVYLYSGKGPVNAK
ncbi:hypothetical protein VPHK327_0020 [Vibrio phage K327]